MEATIDSVLLRVRLVLEELISLMGLSIHIRVGALTKLVTIVGWFAGCRNWPQLEMLSQFEILLKCLGNCVVQLKQGAHNSEDVQTIGKQCFKGFYVQFVRRPTGGRFFVYYFTFCNTKLPFWKANLNQFRHAKKNTV